MQMVNNGYYHYLLAKRSGIKIQKLALGFLCGGLHVLSVCVCVCVRPIKDMHVG